MIEWDLTSAYSCRWLMQESALESLLSPSELATFAGLRMPKRRSDWLLGRVALKNLCRAWLAARGMDMPLPAIVIGSAANGAPFAALADGAALRLAVSLSHRAGVALAGLCDQVNVRLGVDVELCEPRPEGFLDDFFTGAEAAAVLATPDPCRSATEVWSVKESLLKALGVGLTMDTRAIEVEPRRSMGSAWDEICVVRPARPGARVFVRDEGPFVLTLAVVGEGDLPAPHEGARRQSRPADPAHVESRPR